MIVLDHEPNPDTDQKECDYKKMYIDSNSNRSKGEFIGGKKDLTIDFTKSGGTMVSSLMREGPGAGVTRVLPEEAPASPCQRSCRLLA
jgi:hypothetical protein